MTPGFTVPGRAVVRAPLAPMYAEPHVTSIQVSQRLRGHEVELREAQDDWLYVQGSDGYPGWIHQGFLKPGRNKSADAGVSLGCVVRDSVGAHLALPLGARLLAGDNVERGEMVSGADLANRFPPTATAVTHSAHSFFEGTPYLWGGITPWGADCSGFVQTIFGLHGISLPRDAWQQSGIGTRAGALDQLRPADLAFFSDRSDKTISHVAIALGDRRLVNLALSRGGYAVENLDAPDEHVRVLRERFVGARRLLP